MAELSMDWMNDDEMEDAQEEVFGGGFESDRIEGHQAVDTKIVMAYVVNSGSSDAQAIKLSFVDKNDKKLEETIWVKGRDGKPFTVKDGKKVQTFGVNKIMSLLKVTNLFPDSKNLMKSLFETLETADVTETNYGKEETNEQEVLTGLLDVKVKLCVSSKKVNATTSATNDDADEQKYIDQCVKDTKKFIIANPKKKSLKKFADSKQSKEYPNVYKWFTESSIQHFCSLDGLFADEDERKKLDTFIAANQEGFISDGRTLIADEMTEKELAKLSINKFGKRVEPTEDDGYEEPVEETEEDDDEDGWV